MGGLLSLGLCAQLLLPRYNPISPEKFANLVIRAEASLCSFLRVLSQGLEQKVPDCAVSPVC